MSAGSEPHSSDWMPPDPQRAPWDASPGFRTEYREQLRALDEEFVAIGELIASWASAIEDAERGAPSEGDLEELSERAERLEDAAFTTMAREAPVGGDLRATVAIIRSTYDLLRAGRLVSHIVENLDLLAPDTTPLGESRERDLRQLCQVAIEVFTGGVHAWRDRDVLAVGELRVLDEQASEYRDRLFAELPSDLGARRTVAYVLLCRYLERLADHGVNLAAQLAWSVTGDRVAGHSALGGPGH